MVVLMLVHVVYYWLIGWLRCVCGDFGVCLRWFSLG